VLDQLTDNNKYGGYNPACSLRGYHSQNLLFHNVTEFVKLRALV